MRARGKVVFHQKAEAEAEEMTKAKVGSTLWEHALELGIEMPATCGGQGRCGTCVVAIKEGVVCLTEKTETEQEFSLGEYERLACQAKVISSGQDIHVFMKTVGEYAILTESLEGSVSVDPFVYRRDDAVSHRNFIGETMGRYEGELLGLAIDVGTTTLVLQLVDLQSGNPMATSACKNPQAVYGGDVITRIGYVDHHRDGLSRLKQVVIEASNSMIREIEEKIGKEVRGHIYEAVVVGNPVMRNLFFGTSVHSLGQSPFEPEDTSPLYRKAIEVGLEIHPEAHVYGASLVAGQVGADCLADIVACDLFERDRPCMMVDIGTNGEVAIGNRERILSASNAAGSAFEGATVSCGVGAVEGAIKNVRIREGEVVYETIGGKAPVGICGSGLIDVLAGMIGNGIIDPHGTFSESYQQSKAFTLVDNGMKLRLNQKDINELRLAKAGLVLNQKTLLRKYGLSLDQLETIFLVGGFGHYVNIDNAIGIGILPDRKDKIVKIGNGALAGARQMLLSRERREKAERLAGEIEHVQLFEEENLLDLYVSELNLHGWP